MDNKLSIPKLPKPSDPALNKFLTGAAEEKETKHRQINIKCTEEEMDLIKKGHESCLEKMPGYEYQKRALLEKAARDIKEREEFNRIIAESKK